MCGGTIPAQMRASASRGLSPRVRGNPAPPPARRRCPGSIPACAGEPVPGWWHRGRMRVYPRVCGGTLASASGCESEGGLSPRVRGNHALGAGMEIAGRSIPACAGEPVPTPPPVVAARVYPRVCGGTDYLRQTPAPVKGLSPRVRGNLALSVRKGKASGSIPACAGEPHNHYSKYTQLPVYPRVCGGTAPAYSAMASGRGLSPRVRGNLDGAEDDPGLLGSIPACAGEPDPLLPVAVGRTVYPRVCGGTRNTRQHYSTGWGLSPRVRGNPLDF